jgi:photosystem II stability/assembly factor-like uncharacterized protein
MNRMFASRSVLVATLILVVMGVVPVSPWDGVRGITALTIDPQMPTTLYAGTPDRGLFKSTDGGVTWTATGLTSGDVHALVIDPVAPDTLYAALSESGVVKSTNGGATWSAAGLASGFVRGLVIDPVTPTTLHALIPDGGIYRSTDGGATWNRPLGIASPHATLQALAIDPAAPATIIVAVSCWNDTTYFPWIEFIDIVDGHALSNADCYGFDQALQVDSVGDLVSHADDQHTPPTLYAATGNSGLFKRQLTDGNWRGLMDGLAVWRVVFDPQSPSTLYAATWAGVWKSTDAGATWSALNTGLTNTDVRSLAIDPLTTTTLYAGTPIGLFKTTDGGETWSLTGLFQRSLLADLSLDRVTVIRGDPATATVTLMTEAPPGGVTVALTTDNPTAVTFPPSVTVAEGATSARFTVSTIPAPTYALATISAALDDAMRSAVLSVTPTTAVSSVTLNPTTVTGGMPSTGTVNLTRPALAGGAVVMLASYSTVATVQESVTVPEEFTSADFAVSTSPVAAVASVRIAATYHGTTSADLIVTPSTSLASVGFVPATVPAGTASTGTVNLTAAAPTGGAVVALSSSDATVAVPASVTVPAGATSAGFTVSTTFACVAASATISARYGDITRTAVVTVVPPTPDTVSVQTARYLLRRLTVEAASTSSSATLTVRVTSSGVVIGQLSRLGDGTHRGQFTWPVNPQDITVGSSACGSASSDVWPRAR